MKQPHIYLLLLILGGCTTTTNKLSINKVSPYFIYTIYNDADTNAPYQSKGLEFTLDIHGSKEKYVLDSLLAFIRLEYKKEFDTIRPVLSFTFWRYEKGKIDENFTSPASDQSLYSIGKPLYDFVWHEGNFDYVEKYYDRNKTILLDTFWNKKPPAKIEVIER